MQAAEPQGDALPQLPADRDGGDGLLHRQMLSGDSKKAEKTKRQKDKGKDKGKDKDKYTQMLPGDRETQNTHNWLNGTIIVLQF